jgi:hypothetical protein
MKYNCNMNSPKFIPSFAKSWVSQWKSAAKDLEKLRFKELSNLSDDDARAATLSLFELRQCYEYNEKRLHYSGLVDQQRYFHKMNKRHE